MLLRRTASARIKKRADISAADAIRLYHAARSRCKSLEQFQRALRDLGLVVVQDDLGIFTSHRREAA